MKMTFPLDCQPDLNGLESDRHLQARLARSTKVTVAHDNLARVGRSRLKMDSV